MLINTFILLGKGKQFNVCMHFFVQHVCISGYLKLSSLYRIEKRPAMKGKPFVCEIVSESVQLVLASEDEKMFHLFVFFLQTQTKIKDELEGTIYNGNISPFSPLGLLGIGAFTVTSFAVSRGRLESLVGKSFAAGGLRVYFAGIHSLFAFIYSQTRS